MILLPLAFAAAAWQTTQAPFASLDAAYPFAANDGHVVSEDGAVAFLAEGASIAVLDLSTQTLIGSGCGGGGAEQRLAIGYVPIRMAHQMEPDPVGGGDKPAERGRLFLAAGAQGMIPVELDLPTCHRVRPAQPGADPGGQAFCMDVQVVEVGGTDYVFALYSGIGINHVMVFDPLGNPLSGGFYLTLPGEDTTKYGAIGYGFDVIASGPDTAHVYVAMGVGDRTAMNGAVRDLEIDLATMTATPVNAGPSFYEVMLQTLPVPARDVVVRGGNAYVAADQAGVARLALGPNGELPSATTQLLPISTSTGERFAVYRVAAAEVASTVYVAAAANGKTANEVDGAPFSTFGIWSTTLNVGGLPKAPEVPVSYLDELPLNVYEQTATGLTLRTCASADSSWLGLELREDAGALTTYESHWEGFYRRDLGAPPFAGCGQSPPPSTFLYDGPGIFPIGGAVAWDNPDLLYVGLDGAEALPGSGMERTGLWQVNGVDLAEVPGTKDYFPVCAFDECGTSTPVPRPNPFKNGFLGNGQWFDASTARQWFVGGTTGVRDQCAGAPWDPNWCADNEAVEVGPQAFPDPGWIVLEVDPSDPSTLASDLRWWQLGSPPDSAGFPGRNYMSSFGHPADGEWVHLLRSGTPEGYLIVDRSELMTLPDQAGTGQVIDMDLAGIDYTVVRTHYEFTGAGVTGSDAPRARWFQYAGENDEPFAAIACGRVSPAGDVTAWTDDYADRAFGLIYNLQPLQVSRAPELRLILMGTEVDDTDFETVMATAGSAWSIEVVERPSGTWALLGDFGGRLFAYRLEDLSILAKIQDPAAPIPPEHGVTPVSQADVAFPTVVLAFPPSPFDDLHENVIDMAADGDLLYVTMGRRGVAVVDLTGLDALPYGLVEHPSSPLKTPGLAEGLMLLRSGPEVLAGGLVLGDGRGGLELYH